MAAKAFVTGVAGFVGSHVGKALLADRWEVVGVDSFSDSYDPRLKERNVARLVDLPAFRLVRADLCDADLPPLLDGVDTIFHLAAQAGVRRSWGDRFARYVRANILATQRLLEAARRVPVRRFVFSSSSSVYGEAERLPVRESSPKRPFSPYGVTKLAAENLGHLYRRNHGIPFVALRYFTVYGPRQRPDMAFFRILAAVSGGQPFPVYGTGEQTRDFTYVGDIARANLLAAAAEAPGRAYNIGGGARRSLSDVFRIVEEITGREVPRVEGAREKGDVRDTWSDGSAAARDLRFHPEVSLVEGLGEMARWFDAEGAGAPYR